MPKATRLVAVLLLTAFVCTASSAFAAHKPIPQSTPLVSGTSIAGVKLGPNSVQSTCTLGVTGAPAYIVNYVLPPNDQYYTLVNPADCAACGGGPVTALDANVYLNFRATCSQTISVGIYGLLPGTACPTPDPNQVLCPPINYTLTPPAPGNYLFTMALPAGCCISGPAFLKIEFVDAAPGCDQSTTVPRLITTADCSAACSSWNIYPAGGPDDLCVDIGFPGQPNMSLDVDCCNSTPTIKHSWGSLKSTYR